MFEIPKFAVGGKLKELSPKFKDLVKLQFTDATTLFKWKQMTCFEVKLKEPTQNLAICSTLADRIQRLRMTLSNQIIRVVMANAGITDYQVMDMSKRQRDMSNNADYDAFRNWSYESW